MGFSGSVDPWSRGSALDLHPRLTYNARNEKLCRHLKAAFSFSILCHPVLNSNQRNSDQFLNRTLKMHPSQTVPRTLPRAVRMMSRPSHGLTQFRTSLVRPNPGFITSIRHLSNESKQEPSNLEKEILSLNNDLKLEAQTSDQLKRGLEGKVQILIKELSQARETEKRLTELAKQTEKYADWAHHLRQWETEVKDLEARLRMMQVKENASLFARFRATKTADRLRRFSKMKAAPFYMLTILPLVMLLPKVLQEWLGLTLEQAATIFDCSAAAYLCLYMGLALCMLL